VRVRGSFNVGGSTGLNRFKFMGRMSNRRLNRGRYGRHRHPAGMAAEAFNDLNEDVRQCIRRIKASPFIPRKNVRGFVYDVATGALREVEA
jgi:carbonic anhydrase